MTTVESQPLAPLGTGLARAAVCVTPLLSVKGTFRWDISDAFAAVGELYFKIDNNQTTFYTSTAGLAEPVFATPYQLGFNAVLQARF